MSTSASAWATTTRTSIPCLCFRRGVPPTLRRHPRRRPRQLPSPLRRPRSLRWRPLLPRRLHLLPRRLRPRRNLRRSRSRSLQRLRRPCRPRLKRPLASRVSPARSQPTVRKEGMRCGHRLPSVGRAGWRQRFESRPRRPWPSPHRRSAPVGHRRSEHRRLGHASPCLSWRDRKSSAAVLHMQCVAEYRRHAFIEHRHRTRSRGRPVRVTPSGHTLG